MINGFSSEGRANALDAAARRRVSRLTVSSSPKSNSPTSVWALSLEGRGRPLRREEVRVNRGESVKRSDERRRALARAYIDVALLFERPLAVLDALYDIHPVTSPVIHRAKELLVDWTAHTVILLI